jgi:hypothetical protein
LYPSNFSKLGANRALRDTPDAEHDLMLMFDDDFIIDGSWPLRDNVAARMGSPPPSAAANSPGPFETDQPSDDGIERSHLGYRALQMNESPTINPVVLTNTSASSYSPPKPFVPPFDTNSPETSSVDSTLDFQDGFCHDLDEICVGIKSYASPI